MTTTQLKGCATLIAVLNRPEDRGRLELYRADPHGYYLLNDLLSSDFNNSPPTKLSEAAARKEFALAYAQLVADEDAFLPSA